MMKLWLVRPKPEEEIDSQDYPWKPWYDKSFGFVVRAENMKKAREIASQKAGDEKAEAWLDPKYSSCVRLTDKGKEGIILQDFAAA